MNVKKPLILSALVLMAVALTGQESRNTLDLGVAPYFSLPVRQESGLIQSGGGADVSVLYRFSGLPLAVGGMADASMLPVSELNTSLSLFGLGAGTRLAFNLGPSFAVTGMASGGFYYATLNNNSGVGGGNPWFLGGLGMDWAFSPSWVLAGNVDWRSRIGLVDDLKFSLAVRFQPTVSSAPLFQPASNFLLPPGFVPLKNEGRGLQIIGYKLDPVFPVLQRTYEAQGQGTLVLHNFGALAVDQVTLAAEVKTYGIPRTIKLGTKVAPGQDVQISVPALLTEKLVALTEGADLTVNLTLNSVQDGRTTRKAVPLTVALRPSKAVVWDSPARMASFVSPRSGATQLVAKAVQAVAAASAATGVNPEFLALLATHTTLNQLGVAYVRDPASAFNNQSSTGLDALQFPQDTLAARTGDSEDLTVLWCSLLEAMGIESAALTYPGHMFPAVALAEKPQEILALWDTGNDFLVRDGKYWVPLEATRIKEGFFAAWQEGARQVRDRKDSLQFTPVREAWKTYPTSDYPGSAPAQPILPAGKKLETEVKALLAEKSKGEMKLRILKLLADIKTAPEDQVPVLENKLGIAYAKDGQYLHAIEVFKRSAARKFPAAQANLGSAYLLAAMTKSAITAYNTALTLQAGNKAALTGLVLAYRIYLDPALTKATLARVARVDADLSKKLAALKGTDLASLRGWLIWSE